MNAYLYLQELGSDRSKATAIASAAPSWAAEYCFIDHAYLNYEDTDPPKSECEHCLHLPTLEQAIADFELMEKVGGFADAKRKVLYAKKSGHETISVPVVMDGKEGFGCLYIDVLEAALLRVEKALHVPAQAATNPVPFKIDDVVVPVGDHWGKSPNAVTVVEVDGIHDFRGQHSTGLERRHWYKTVDWRLASDEEKKWMCRSE